MTTNSNSYISTVKTEGKEFWQPATTSVGAANTVGSSYRITGVHYGDKEEQEEIKRVIVISLV